MYFIDWEDAGSHLLLNPSYNDFEKDSFRKILKEGKEWPGHIWLSTSGSFSVKWVGLSKQSLLASADSVNKHLKSDSRDIWIKALPDFHVGGLGIWARAFLSGAKVYDFKAKNEGKWNASSFYSFINDKKGTLTTLVPAQLHDLVSLKQEAPITLKAIVIGGGALASDLYQAAIRLKWPVLPSYGLTECGSQVATAPLNSWRSGEKPAMELLPHLQVRIEDKRISIKGSSLFSTYASIKEDKVIFANPKDQEGWFLTEDRGEFSEGKLSIFGRLDAIIKIGGESVDFAGLERHFENIRLSVSHAIDAALIPIPNERLGHAVHLAITSPNNEYVQLLMERYNQTVLPFERIRQVHSLSFIPRSPLGKILKEKLKEIVLLNKDFIL